MIQRHVGFVAIALSFFVYSAVLCIADEPINNTHFSVVSEHDFPRKTQGVVSLNSPEVQNGGDTGTVTLSTEPEVEAGRKEASDVSAEFTVSNRSRTESTFQSVPSASLSQVNEKFSDAGFDAYIDLSRLQTAFLKSDVSALADIVVSLAEAERVLQREHKSGLTADDLMERVAVLLARNASPETLERIRRASSRLERESWREILNKANEFASASREAVPNFSLNELATYKVMQMKAIVDAIHSAGLHRQPKLFQSIKQEIDNLAGLSKSERDYLLREFSSARQYSQEHSDGGSSAADLLWELQSASRGGQLLVGNRASSEIARAPVVPAESTPQCCGASSSIVVTTAKGVASAPTVRESNRGHEKTTVSPGESVADPSFDGLVDLQLLGKAVNSNDVAQMIDVLFALAERERVLQRTHRSGLSASGLFLRIAGYAARHGDAEAISRLERGAVKTDRSEWTRQLKALREFSATQRSTSPRVSLSQVTSDKLIAVASVSRIMKWADLTGSTAALDRVESELASTPHLSKLEKAFFRQQLNQVRQAVSQPEDVTSEVIREFASKSRGACGTGWNEPWVRDRWGNADFTSACRAHDKCYETCGASKRSCDDQFERDLRDICRRAYNSWVHRVQREACLGMASKYALAVRRLGGDAYRNAQYLACRGTPGGTVPDVDRRTYRVDIVNPHANPIYYKVNGEEFKVDGNRSRWHSRRGSPYFNVEFDASSATGYQSHRKSLIANRKYRFRWSGRTLALDEYNNGASQTEYKIWIENPYSFRINYKVNGESFYVDGNRSRWHSRRGNSTFNVEFDWSFSDGYQRRGYRLTPGSRNYFSKVANGLDLYRR